jgi:hypothetical protein
LNPEWYFLEILAVSGGKKRQEIRKKFALLHKSPPPGRLLCLKYGMIFEIFL